jgi:Ni2+-binding GTPase involved in maturation of urease and hydrogenase
MKIFIIAGFLGAGKTSLIGFIAKQFSARGQKTAVIENEFSASGVDSDYLTSQGIFVRELAAGCICCQLKTDFITALLLLEKEYAPDIVLVEPTGAAAPDAVKETLRSNILTPPVTVALVDLRRFKSIGSNQYPFLEQTIRVADVIILNKSDQVTPDITVAVTDEVKALNPYAECLAVSILTGDNLDKLLAILDRVIGSNRRFTGGEEIQTLPVAAFYEFKLDAAAINTVAEKMQRLAENLRQFGCTLLGHLKVVTADANGNTLFVSLTGFDQPADISKKTQYSASGVQTFKLNAVVYGISKRMLLDAIAAVFH